MDAFLPIVVDVDNKSVFAGFTNEATFASNFAQESGILTNDTLHQYQNFQISGMVIKKSVIDEFGGIKPTIKLTFGYEFLLRLTYNSAKIMTIPKLGYKHINLRPDSIFWEYKEGSQKLLEPEVKFWVSTAKKEQAVARAICAPRQTRFQLGSVEYTLGYPLCCLGRI